jgi:hypothetical protein
MLMLQSSTQARTHMDTRGRRALQLRQDLLQQGQVLPMLGKHQYQKGPAYSALNPSIKHHQVWCFLQQ